ncbi:hypothetical protein JCM11491_005310 [Sporobolomyces phaffii]
MVVYGLYIFDKHCVCCYYTSPPPVASTSAGGLGTKPATGPHARKAPGATTLNRVLAPVAAPLITDSLLPDDADADPNNADATRTAPTKDARLPFDEEAKLVYGVVFSLRNMVKKLSSRESDSFHSFSTSTYKLHSLSTPSAFHFVLVTSPTPHSCRPLLRSIYTGPFNEFVVRNPLVHLDTRTAGAGIGNERFRREVDRVLLSSGV